MPVERIHFMQNTDRMFKDKGQKRRIRHFTKKIRETRSNDQRHESGRLKHVTEENVTTAEELVGPLSQEGQTQTRHSTCEISKEMGLTQCSIIQIIH